MSWARKSAKFGNTDSFDPGGDQGHEVPELGVGTLEHAGHLYDAR